MGEWFLLECLLQKLGSPALLPVGVPPSRAGMCLWHGVHSTCCLCPGVLRDPPALPPCSHEPWPCCLLLAAAPALEWRGFAHTAMSHHLSMLESHRAGGKQ